MNQESKPAFSYAVLERVESFTEAEFNELPVGAIKLDREGQILKYNAYESRLAGRSVEEVMGKNFFTEVAPCTNVAEFAGRFRNGLAEGNLNATFPYRFLFPHNYVDVEITMTASKDRQGAWVFVREIGRAVEK